MGVGRSRRSGSSPRAAPIAVDNDATHTPMFHQVEGLVIDKRHPHGPPEVDPGDLPRAVLRDRCGDDRSFRPHHFPFTEPSAEMDEQCDRSGGEIKIGQGTAWLEIAGLRDGPSQRPARPAASIRTSTRASPSAWASTGWAMLKYGMPDLRDMFASDGRWLGHYGF